MQFEPLPLRPRRIENLNAVWPGSAGTHVRGAVAKWCTLTTTDGDGKRYSLDVQAESSYDAAHLYL
jgi:hypothetical protein